jgi:hypothetical protein
LGGVDGHGELVKAAGCDGGQDLSDVGEVAVHRRGGNARLARHRAQRDFSPGIDQPERRVEDLIAHCDGRFTAVLDLVAPARD